MINSRRGKTLTTNIPIYTLSGGVGRQAPSKRLPTESEELINALCSVERSVEKRPGTDLMPVYVDSETYTGEDLGLDPEDATHKYEFFWHALSDTARYLFVVNRAATSGQLYHVFYFDQINDKFDDHTPASQTIADEVRAYITYKPDGQAEYTPLKLVTRGQNLVFLNPDVHAGYTSKKREFTTGDTLDRADGSGVQITESGEYWCEIDLNGKFIGEETDAYVEDARGLEVDYKTAVKVDPGQIATFYDTYSTYARGAQVLYIPGTQVLTGGTPVNDNGVFEAETDAADTYYYILQAQQANEAESDLTDITKWVLIATDFTGALPAGIPDLDADREPKQISVKDWQYPDSTKAGLGQSLPTFNDLVIPPLENDVKFGNNTADEMLEALYPDLQGNNVSTNSSEGKVFYIQAGYQGQPPGYYLAKSVDSPSFQKVRTPDPYSVIDEKRMPMELEFTGVTAGVSTWEWSTIDWAHRTSGDLGTNRGPTPFRDGRQSKLSTIAFFRNRLWLSSGDVMFSSQSDNFTDLWLEDPGLLVDTDPIDIAASTNTFTPITAMVPFKDYMFVNTNADVQYELMGSENQITPFTAELQPMTFYSTAPLVDPLTLGNYIFFFDAERLYLYMGRGGTLSTAQELSSHCPKYLPENFGSTTVAPAQDTILAVDADSDRDVYAYTTKYRGNEIAQNAFYRFSYDGASVRAMKTWDNDNYMVVYREDGFFIERQHMRFQDTDIPLLDRKQKIPLTFGSLSVDRTADNAQYDAAAFTTTIRVPFLLSDRTHQLIDSQGVAYRVDTTVENDDANGTWTDITVPGDLSAEAFVWLGEKFTMQIQLSTQFVRDQSNNAQEGILNLASMRTSHFETGNYDVITQRRGRPSADVLAAYQTRDMDLDNYTTTFVAPRADVAVNESNLPLLNVEYQGELVSKIMGYSEKVDIYILSDYFTPVNITNVELKGKFTQKYSGVL